MMIINKEKKLKLHAIWNGEKWKRGGRVEKLLGKAQSTM